jgi:cellulose synthase/poly-beta-1,6-N-acetylglucosamine synthase-like glycosyltransferase
LGEDIDLSIRILKNGFRCELIPEAYVFHKRKTNFLQFFKQTFNFGKTRIDIFLKHPQELKITHLFPAFFVIYTWALLVLWILPLSAFYKILFSAPWLLYLITIGIDAAIFYKSLSLGILSIAASFVQLWGYGLGFLYHFILKFKDVVYTLAQKQIKTDKHSREKSY